MSGVKIEGLADFRAALKECVDASPRELTKVLAEGGKRLKAQAQQNKAAISGPRSTGKIAGSFQVFTQAKQAGFKSTLPQAGVYEFATAYKRTRGGQSSTVHFSSIGPTPRFGYKALESLAEELTQLAFDALVTVAKAHGWFEETG